MTYNFDPERWYRNELANLRAERESGALEQRAYEDALQTLDLRYDRMVDRLDGTYQIPPTRRPAQEGERES